MAVGEGGSGELFPLGAGVLAFDLFCARLLITILLWLRCRHQVGKALMILDKEFRAQQQRRLSWLERYLDRRDLN